ncbi:MAG: hypothetical protein ACPHO4_12485, partial [Longimicrobiales bacterium]
SGPLITLKTSIFNQLGGSFSSVRDAVEAKGNSFRAKRSVRPMCSSRSLRGLKHNKAVEGVNTSRTTFFELRIEPSTIVQEACPHAVFRVDDRI